MGKYILHDKYLFDSPKTDKSNIANIEEIKQQFDEETNKKFNNFIVELKHLNISQFQLNNAIGLFQPYGMTVIQIGDMQILFDNDGRIVTMAKTKERREIPKNIMIGSGN